MLQARSPETARRLARLIRKRLQTMKVDLWKLVRDGTGEVATHAILAAAVKHSPLLGDFLDLVVREQYRIFKTTLAIRLGMNTWMIAGDAIPICPSGMNPQEKRLRSSVFQILAQAGFLENTRNRKLQTVRIATKCFNIWRRTKSIIPSVVFRFHHDRRIDTTLK